MGAASVYSPRTELLPGKCCGLHTADFSQRCSQAGHVRGEVQPHRGPLPAGTGHTLCDSQHPPALPCRGVEVPGRRAHHQTGQGHAGHLGRRHHREYHVLHGILHPSRLIHPPPQVVFSILQVLLVATHITAVGWRCAGCSDCGTRRNAFLSAVLSKLALLGSTACFILSGVGLTNGPLCLYNASEHGRGPTWGYPFLDTGSQASDTRVLVPADYFLYKPDTWDTCLEPVGIVAWNVALFSLLLLVSAAEMVLASIQILNGCAGCLCGFCEGKQGRPTRLD
ncbi:transmembrane 4 L6 family member 19 isoform X1 [Cygnus olor]|uniref:transmembrane 4 L6 family member 19 isoform X1 n=1 Tax=Cygnus olor TaxID=8869 RepID=UPI001ADE4A73|nr:transmembrane 4 L6 family member 19 isoform X1 [Cygnus olor]